MRIFVTGATGFIGSAVVNELIRSGHEVVGLARSEKAAKEIRSSGGLVQNGDLGNLESLRSGAANADGVIHTAFNHDFSKFKENSEVDRKVIETLGLALSGSDRPLIVTSAIGILAQGQLVNEENRALSTANPRVASEEAADKLAEKGIKVAVVRLPPSVHGEGDHAFIPALVKIAREKGVSVYANEGQNHWPAVHRLDAAKVFRLAVENKAAPGTRYHSVAERGIPFRKIAEAIGHGLNIPTAGKSTREAAEHFGWFAHFAAMDIQATAKWTKERLGWEPTHPGLIEDLNSGIYF